VADALSGQKGFFQEACRSLSNLVSAGVPVTVNAVAVRPICGDFENLAELLCKLGVTKLEVSPYVPPVTERKAAASLLVPEDEHDLQREVETLSQKYKNEIEIKLGASGAIPSATEGCRDNICEVGFTELHVLPDGQATRCRYLPREKTLMLGSLETQSIREIWEGQKLRALNQPSNKIYENTACKTCSEFAGCNARGRCYVSAMARSKSLFAPDQFCVVQ